MATVERLADQGSPRARRLLAGLGDELHEKRIATGLSQERVARAAGISRWSYIKIEHGEMPSLSVLTASRCASVLGLDLSVRVYPGGSPLRDEASIKRLGRVLAHVGHPLTYRTEVALPTSPNHQYEQRAWDAVVYGVGLRTGFEVEMRIRDAQALERGIELKRRDDPVDRLVVLVADTSSNRRVIREHPTLLVTLSRVSLGTITRLLRAGQHPPDALLFV